MDRKILLVEPNYKNKYPPIGLMKLATYYKMQGDEVTFFKGDLRQLVVNDIYELLIEKLYSSDNSVFWKKYKPEICQYILKGQADNFDKIISLSSNKNISTILKYYRKYYYNKEYFKEENRKYDRVGITTLFTK